MLCQCSQEANLKFDVIQETYDKVSNSYNVIIQ